ncbi:hypothetical protein JQ494_01825 [Helicobacter pylori]|uniref:hypothetical protein n=1 Tax=Helicobacter pylori TaxID=210 RepID=UPI00193A2FB9|nr:hypothetical protein [Helicobacter pylori]MBM2660156.1 hypothetical protein [Helicobacter pylori]
MALYLAGCGSDSSEPLVEVEKNFFNSTVKIISKADNIEIQDLKLNRGNCKHDKNLLKKLIQETANAYLFVSEKEKAIKNHQAKIARLQKDLEELTQWVQQFNNLDKLLENGGLFVSDKYTKDDNPIYVVKRMLDNLDSYKYESDVLDVPYEKLLEISIAIEDTKNPKDYPYINLKELKKLMDGIVDVHDNMADDFLDEYSNRVSKKGFQRLAKLKSMWPSVGKFYFAYLKEAIPRHAKEVTDKMISSEEKSIKANQVKLTEATQNIDKMEKIIKDLESKKNTMAVDLKFGESFTAHYKCQNLIEVGVKTDKGAWTFNFKR